MEYFFSRTLGQESSQENIRQTLEQKRFPHALLVHGEPGLGQHALLLDLAQILVCDSDRGKIPCQTCRSCLAFKAKSLETIHYLMPLVKKMKEDEDGEKETETELEDAQIDELIDHIKNWHEHPYGCARPEKALVRVGQIRELLARLSFVEGKNRARVVLVPYLEALHPAAANALLKTLEEPPAGTYFLIASEHRGALLPTLLSRCLHLGLAPLSMVDFRKAAEEISRSAQKPLSRRLFPFSEGSPGIYWELLEGGEALLEEAGLFLSAATAGDWRVFSEYVEGPVSESLKGDVRLLHFLMSCLRVHLSWRAKYPASLLGREDAYRWTSKALEAEGWDSDLTGYLGPLEDLADPHVFVSFLESSYNAIKKYSKPQVSLLGFFLEYESKAARFTVTVD